MVTGYYISRAIFVTATLGIADLLAHGPQSSSALAKEAPSRRSERDRHGVAADAQGGGLDLNCQAAA